MAESIDNKVWIDMRLVVDGKMVKVSVGDGVGWWSWGRADTCCGHSQKILCSLDDVAVVWDRDNPANNMKLNRLVYHIIETLELHAS